MVIVFFCDFGLVGKFVSVKLVVKFEGERKFVNVKELKIAE